MNYDYAANRHKLVDSMGRRLTTGLFEELKDAGTAALAVFSLHNWKRVYVDICDPTGYRAAMVLIGDWDHWMLLVNNPIFKAHLDEWNKEVACHLKSDAIDELRKQATLPTGTSAAKYIAEHGYAKKEKKQKGEETLPEVLDRAGSDAKRLGLKAVK